ncbi:MAG: hypothetical protein ACRDH6_02140 [Actinomycetota bacterium]
MAGALVAWPGRIETPALVKRRLLVVSMAMSLILTGFIVLQTSYADAPFTNQQLEDLSGLPRPPVPYVSTDGGSMKQLTPAEVRQLERIRQLIEHFPVPDAFVNSRGTRDNRARENTREGGG